LIRHLFSKMHHHMWFQVSFVRTALAAFWTLERPFSRVNTHMVFIVGFILWDPATKVTAENLSSSHCVKNLQKRFKTNCHSSNFENFWKYLKNLLFGHVGSNWKNYENLFYYWLSAPFLKCDNQCLFKELLQGNLLPHVLQMNGFSPVWIRMWYSKFDLFCEILPHTRHWKCFRFRIGPCGSKVCWVTEARLCKR
jgi:hypothetical protein